MKVITDEKIPIKMWLEKIEPGAEKQARNLANLAGAFHHIAIMPDAHVGYGMPIGGVLATEGIIIPNAVGVDIGCGMVAVESSIKEIDEYTLKEILNKLRKTIPTGFTHHKQAQNWEGFSLAPDVPIINQELNSARKQIGTLGGGNHFLEVLKEVDESRFNIRAEGNIWLMLHSGSRNFGKKVADVYHKKAHKYCEENNISLPDHDLAFLKFNSRLGQEYWQAMNFCLEFARANRALMLERFMEIVGDITGCSFLKFMNKEDNNHKLKLSPTPSDSPSGRGRTNISSDLPYFGIHHNYASVENHFGKEVIVHRKGATQAYVGQLGIVPGSMGTPSYVVIGLGNPESFMSSAHGAGRAMGRREADRQLTREQADAAIRGIIFEGWRGKLDEAPQAYKNIEEVITAQADLAKPIVKLKPLMVMIGN
ncbi:MAG: RtcB family protein [Patescibacteria group bacterium]